MGQEIEMVLVPKFEYEGWRNLAIDRAKALAVLCQLQGGEIRVKELAILDVKMDMRLCETRDPATGEIVLWVEDPDGPKVPKKLMAGMEVPE